MERVAQDRGAASACWGGAGFAGIATSKVVGVGDQLPPETLPKGKVLTTWVQLWGHN